MQINKPSEPTDYYEEIDGEILPPAQSSTDKGPAPEDYNHIGDVDHLLDERIKLAAIRVGNTAITPAGKLAGMSDEEYFRALREERESDRQGTHPGTSRGFSRESSRDIKKSKYEGRELTNGETLEKGQVSVKKFYTDKETKKPKSYSITVAYIERARDGKAIRLESDKKVPENGGSKFLIAEWDELEKRIDSGEGREL